MHDCNFDKKKVTARLNRITGQVKALGRQIDEDQDCSDIITQCKAIKGAISKIEEILLERHLRCCLVHAIEKNKEDKIIQDILDIYKFKQ